MPSAVTPHRDLEPLKALDRIDRRVLKLERDAAALPDELAPFKKEVARLERELQAQHALQKELQKEIDQLELEVRSNRDQIGKYRAQQNTAKTNEEYAALKKQILALEAKSSAHDDKALQDLERLDELKPAEKAVQKELEQARQKLQAEEADIQREVGRLQEEIAALRKERDEAAAAVSSDNRGLYERVLRKTGDRALASLEGGRCQGCFLEVPTNLVGLVSVGQDIVVCRQCNRILYMD